MKKLALITLVYLAFLQLGIAQTIPTDSLYLGQARPGANPKIFKLAATKGLFCGERIAFSPDGSVIYYSELDKYPVSKSRSKYYKYSDNKWNGPFILFENLIAPTFSITGDTIYLQKFPPNDIRETYLSAKTGSSWGAPKRILTKLGFTHNFQVTKNGKLHVLANSSTSIGGSDWSLLKINGSDTTVVSLGLPINTVGDDGDYYVAKDESYMILNIDQGGGNWGLFVTFKKNNGTWTKPKNMGKTVNFANSSWGPYVTPDNKYMFFTAGFKADYSDTYTYWMRFDSMLDSLKKSNNAPYVSQNIPYQKAIKDSAFSYQIPANTFIDDDENCTLRYTATLDDGSALPSWLSFNSVTGKFSGKPSSTGYVTIKLTATDNAQASASLTFYINVVLPTNVADNEKLPTEFALCQNYPNPFNPSTIINYQLPVGSNVRLKIYDTLGREVKSLVDSFQSAGEHSITWNAKDNSNNSVSSGIYFCKMESNEMSFLKKMILVR